MSDSLMLSTLAGGLGQPADRIDVTFPRLQAGSTTTAAFTTGVVYLYRFQLSRPIVVTKMGIRMGATSVSNTTDIGIYSGTITGTTFTRLGSTGPFTPTVNVETERALTANVSLEAGVPYWAAYGTNDGTNTTLRLGIDSVVTFTGNFACARTGTWSSGLPASISGSIVATVVAPWLSLVTT